MVSTQSLAIGSFDFRPRTRVVFGVGEFARLGEIARDLGGTRCLLVADRGLQDTGYIQEASRALKARRMDVREFHDFDPNPDSKMVEAGCEFARAWSPDLIVALGGGSSMDCAKGINFLLTNGGVMRDFWGYGKAAKPMIPMIAVPTTAGTGSEAQSYAIVADAETKVKMACGDPKAAFRTALLDPQLTLTQPKTVTAVTGYDAMSHAIESYVTAKRNPLSQSFSREAWRLLESNYEAVVRHPDDLDARAGMLLGAHYAGMAIELSMLGATHACANPLTAGFGITHGTAIALMLPHVVRWNSSETGALYRELYAGDLAERLRELAEAGGLPLSLREAGVPREALPRLAEEASIQWTGKFNPRPFDASAALELYECAF
jgi:alcohol dehydrogenase